MAVAQATLFQRVRDILLDNPWPASFVGNINASTATVPVPDGTRWEEGAILEFEDTGEQVYVVSVSANNLTVIRGFNGTTKAAHDGSVTPIIVYRDPAFTYKRIQDSVELILQSLYPYVYQKVTTSITPVSGTVWYNLNAAAVGLISVSQLSSSTPYTYYRYGVKGTRRPVAFEMNVPTTLAASTVAIGFPRGFATTTSVQVDYGSRITNATSGSNYTDIADGVQAETVAYGAAARLVMQADAQRTTTEDINMGDSSVQPGMRTRVGRDLWAQHAYNRGLWQEDLRKTIPLMSRTNYSSSTSNIGTSTPPYP